MKPNIINPEYLRELARKFGQGKGSMGKYVTVPVSDAAYALEAIAERIEELEAAVYDSWHDGYYGGKIVQKIMFRSDHKGEYSKRPLP